MGYSQLPLQKAQAVVHLQSKRPCTSHSASSRRCQAPPPPPSTSYATSPSPCIHQCGASNLHNFGCAAVQVDQRALQCVGQLQQRPLARLQHAHPHCPASFGTQPSQSLLQAPGSRPPDKGSRPAGRLASPRRHGASGAAAGYAGTPSRPVECNGRRPEWWTGTEAAPSASALPQYY